MSARAPSVSSLSESDRATLDNAARDAQRALAPLREREALAGEIRSQVDGGPAKVFQQGETWTEMPGAAHTVSENASKTKPAKLLAIYVVNTDETNELNTIDGQ